MLDKANCEVAKTSGPFATLDSSWRRRKDPALTSRRSH